MSDQRVNFICGENFLRMRKFRICQLPKSEAIEFLLLDIVTAAKLPKDAWFCGAAVENLAPANQPNAKPVPTLLAYFTSDEFPERDSPDVPLGDGSLIADFWFTNPAATATNL